MTSESFTVKARIFAAGLIDIVIDLVLPTLVYVLLTPTGQSQSVRLAVGGFCVAAKSVTGQVKQSPRTAVLQAVALAVVAGALTLGLAAGGVGDGWAIGAGSLVLAAVVVPTIVRRRSVDGFALLVLFEVALSIVLLSISDDPRFILVRPAFYTAIFGIYAFVTCWTDRPFMMEVSRPMAAGGDAERAAAFDRTWFVSAAFRKAERAMTAGLGVVLLLEALLRVVAVYSQPEGAVLKSSLISQLPSIVLFVGYLVAIRVLAVPVASREVDKEVARTAAESSGGTAPGAAEGATEGTTSGKAEEGKTV